MIHIKPPNRKYRMRVKKIGVIVYFSCIYVNEFINIIKCEYDEMR